MPKIDHCNQRHKAEKKYRIFNYSPGYPITYLYQGYCDVNDGHMFFKVQHEDVRGIIYPAPDEYFDCSTKYNEKWLLEISLGTAQEIPAQGKEQRDTKGALVVSQGTREMAWPAERYCTKLRLISYWEHQAEREKKLMGI